MSDHPGRDLRRAISRQAWLANRAANALHRPAFILAISVATFVTALVSMVVVPRAQRRATTPIVSIPRPDTLSLLASAVMLRLRAHQADSSLSATRLSMAADAARFESELLARQATDTAAALAGVKRDSLEGRLRQLDRLIARADQAPLPASYRAFADVPELQGDTRVHALLDSLAEIEREREGFGAVGGVDPIFVALTSRASDIGKAIEAIASQRRAALQDQLAQLPAPAQATTPVAGTDTLPMVAERDSAMASLSQMERELERRRGIARTLDLDEERARERANSIAPPLALLAAAFVLSAVFGFGAALFGELRRPRVANAQELERFLGVRVLSRIESAMPSIDRGRRQSDQSAPPYLDPGAEGYQLAYLGLATDHPSLMSVTVTGDDQSIATVVAANLAAVAAGEARSSLLVDLDARGIVAAALRTRRAPGIAELLARRNQWPDVTIPARVGRDKTIDVVPHGAGTVRTEDFAALVAADSARLSRYYDAVFVSAAPDVIIDGLPAALPAADVVYCAQPGITPLRELRSQLDQMRSAGASIRGVILWDAERPLIPAAAAPPAAASNERPPQTRPQLAPT